MALTIWNYLEPFGTIWNYLEPFGDHLGTIWGLFGPAVAWLDAARLEVARLDAARLLSLRSRFFSPRLDVAWLAFPGWM